MYLILSILSHDPSDKIKIDLDYPQIDKIYLHRHEKESKLSQPVSPINEVLVQLYEECRMWTSK